MKKIIVGMSGGVDSSVTAWILKKKYRVEGLFMKNWEEDDKKNFCNSKKDLEDTELVCKHIGIILHKINFSYEYWNEVFKIFIQEHKKSRTPNPDILCNQKIKFKYFLEYAIQKLGADYIATGHYVRKKYYKKKFHILKGVDKNKDQSYFLHKLNSYQIKKSIFPLGSMLKTQVRKIAYLAKIPVAKKKDSVGICFIGPKKIKNFLNRYIHSKPGKIITTNGKCVGNHHGLIHYTIGQRTGLGIGGIKNFSNNPWYVVKKNISKNLIIVSQGYKNSFLLSKGIIIKKIFFVKKKCFPLICKIQTRYRQKETICIIYKKIKKFKVIFAKPILSVTPGQSAVFYIGDICLGGGIIYKIIYN
ncbi:tRNA 2-thiouridine(34) synthase MnmA [Buchnera aphidicola (Taiwanaphis decaspermi)]|uniref:tRNA 2-thiouridine(34) synthase MnmA n=1 Tax=Buchnera aphidicola TaxID=9 RepID=UPI0031B8AEDE